MSSTLFFIVLFLKEFFILYYFKGEIIGWIERTASEKLRRKFENAPPPPLSPLEDLSSDEDAFAKTGTTPPKGRLNNK